MACHCSPVDVQIPEGPLLAPHLRVTCVRLCTHTHMTERFVSPPLWLAGSYLEIGFALNLELDKEVRIYQGLASVFDRS